MQINEDRLIRQLEGIKKWQYSKKYGSPKNGCGTLHYPTGMGKTYTTLLIINKIIDNINKYNLDIYDYIAHITVPTEELYNQWINEIKIHIKKEYHEKIEVRIINTVVSRLERYTAILNVCDEVHKYYTEDRFKVVDGTIIKYDYLLCLTATPIDSNDRHRQLYKICPIVDYVDEDLAIKKGWISKFVEYNLGIELSEDERVKYNKLSGHITNFLEKFGNKGLPLAQKCLGGGKDSTGQFYTPYQWCQSWAAENGFNPNIQGYQEYHPKAIISDAKTLMQLVRDRKNLVYNSNLKIGTSIALLDKFKDLKTICFSQSTDFATRLGNAINKHYTTEENSKDLFNKLESEVCVIYHSKLETRKLPSPKTGKIIKFAAKRLKDRAIDRIKTGKSRIISSASALDAGFDVRDIRLGLTTSGTQNPTQYKQRGGRVKRIEVYDEDITVLLVNIYFKNTIDESSLKYRQKFSTHNINYVESIDDIHYIPPTIKNKVKQTKLL